MILLHKSMDIIIECKITLGNQYVIPVGEEELI